MLSANEQHEKKVLAFFGMEPIERRLAHFCVMFFVSLLMLWFKICTDSKSAIYRIAWLIFLFSPHKNIAPYQMNAFHGEYNRKTIQRLKMYSTHLLSRNHRGKMPLGIDSWKSNGTQVEECIHFSKYDWMSFEFQDTFMLRHHSLDRSSSKPFSSLITYKICWVGRNCPGKWPHNHITTRFPKRRPFRSILFYFVLVVI